MKHKLKRDISGISLIFSKVIQKASLLVWKGYGNFLEIFGKMKQLDVKHSQFYMENYVTFGILSQSEIKPLLDILEEVSCLKLREQDCHPEYVNNPAIKNEDTLSNFEKYFRFYDLSANQDVLRKLFASLGIKIRAC